MNTRTREKGKVKMNVCRNYYNSYRLLCKAPSMLAMKMGTGSTKYYHVDCKKDSEISIDSKAHCSWCAKILGLEMWTDLERLR